MMTKQEMFDTVTHLRKQGKQSMRGHARAETSMTQNDSLLGRIILKQAEKLFAKFPEDTTIPLTTLTVILLGKMKVTPHEWRAANALVENFFVNNPRFERVRGVGGGIKMLAEDKP